MTETGGACLPRLIHTCGCNKVVQCPRAIALIPQNSNMQLLNSTANNVNGATVQHSTNKVLSQTPSVDASRLEA